MMTVSESAEPILSLIKSLYGENPPPDRPRVLLSWAQSMNGAITAAPCQRTSISCPESLELVYRARVMSEAVLVGAATVLSDDPSLTAHGFGRDPRAVVLDTSLNIPRASRLVSRSGTIILYADDPRGRLPELELSGATLVKTARGPGGIDLAAGLAALYGMGIGRLMVEGGSRVLASFIEGGLADAVLITQAPIILSGGTFAAAGTGSLSPARLRERATASVGADLVVFARVERTEALGAPREE
jgi:diaminohydroxyphosphoribosylaminopyrimidine deaminase/5-amino-6-(5-phosphoribosylamino)uracil reductase